MIKMGSPKFGWIRFENILVDKGSADYNTLPSIMITVLHEVPE